MTVWIAYTTTGISWPSRIIEPGRASDSWPSRIDTGVGCETDIETENEYGSGPPHCQAASSPHECLEDENSLSVLRLVAEPLEDGSLPDLHGGSLAYAMGPEAVQ